MSKGIRWKILISTLVCIGLLGGCGKSASIDDLATNEGYTVKNATKSEKSSETVEGDSESNGIAKEDIKVGYFIFPTRQKAADIPTPMIWEFRECRRT